MTAQVVNDWTAFMDHYGLPLTMLAFLLVVEVWIVRKAWSWLKPKLEQAFSGHMELVESVKNNTTAMKDAIEEQKDAVKDQAVHTKEFIEKLGDHSARVLANHDKIIENQGKIVETQEKVVELLEQRRRGR